MEEETSTELSMMDKKPDDLTVGESLKITAWVAAASMAVPMVLLGAAAVYDKVAWKLHQRKIKKIEAEELPPEAE